jgi:hypothetical protein
MGGVIKLIQFIVIWIVLLAGTVGVGLLLIPLYYWLVFVGGAARVEKAQQKLESTLMKGETVLASGLQQRLFALFSRRQLVAITSSRLIEISRSVLGGFDMRDYQWKDLRDATMSENIIPNVFGAKLGLVSRSGFGTITIDGLPSPIASTIYSHAQAQEQEWEEKNRIRDLEEKRASSGAAVLNVGGYGNQRQDDGDVFVQLEKAKRLFDTGAISDAEYQELKAKIISKGG